MAKKRNKNPPQKWECRDDHERFFRIFESMFESPAFISLSPVATKIYLILKNEYRGNFTGNNVICPYSTIEKYGISRNSISPALRLLEALGFIVREPGTLMREPTVYHFSDKWKEIQDMETAEKIANDLKGQITLEKETRSRVGQAYGDR